MSNISEIITHHSQDIPPGALIVGYSGGLDSSVLLHALAASSWARRRGLSAIHINHHLHPQSTDWAIHCLTTCTALDVSIKVIDVQIEKTKGEGLEAAARRGRYEGFAQSLQSNEVLVLAQHRDDQNETVLLKLMRGAGPEGLAAMQILRKFKQGYLWRPLLRLPRSELQTYAIAHSLKWIDDPSNSDTKLDRNFLRVEIFPRLRERWPTLDKSIGHTIAWQRAASDFIEIEAEKSLGRIRNTEANTLDWQGWLALSGALRDPVLRLWLRTLQLPAPTHFHVEELERQLMAANDRMPCVRWPGVELRRYRDQLYAMKPLLPVPKNWCHQWDGSLLILPAACGQLNIEVYKNGNNFRGYQNCILPSIKKLHSTNFHVRFRQGGEYLKPVGSIHARELRVLFQETGIVPWQRERIPLVYKGDTLLAVGDLWLSEAGEETFTRSGRKLRWDTA